MGMRYILDIDSKQAINTRFSNEELGDTNLEMLGINIVTEVKCDSHRRSGKCMSMTVPCNNGEKISLALGTSACQTCACNLSS